MRKGLIACGGTACVFIALACLAYTSVKSGAYVPVVTKQDPGVFMRVSIGTTFTGELSEWVPSREGVLGSDEALVVTTFESDNPGRVVAVKHAGLQEGLISDITTDMKMDKKWFDNSVLMVKSRDGAFTLYVYELDTKTRYPAGLARLLVAVNSLTLK